MLFILAISPPGIVRGVLELLFSSSELRCFSFKLLLSPLARDTLLNGDDGIPAKDGVFVWRMGELMVTQISC